MDDRQFDYKISARLVIQGSTVSGTCAHPFKGPMIEKVRQWEPFSKWPERDLQQSEHVTQSALKSAASARATPARSEPAYIYRYLMYSTSHSCGVHRGRPQLVWPDLPTTRDSCCNGKQLVCRPASAKVRPCASLCLKTVHALTQLLNSGALRRFLKERLSCVR